MSFGGGGFGSGGFGQNNNTSTGFGSGGFGNNASTGFGSNNASSGGFGSNTNNTGTSIFGSGGTSGGFGANNNSSGFGSQAKPGFGGASTSGGIFGSSSTGGGFGSGNSGFGNTANAGTGFGSTSTNTGGGIFGQKPASTFGSSSTNAGGLFGQGNNSTSSSGFGAPNSNNSNLFTGNQNASAFGAVPEATGTAGHTFTPMQEKEQNSNITNHFMSITFMTPFAKHSFEELRLADYAKGQKHGNAGGQTGAFGQSSGFGGGFGATNNNTATTGFGTGNTGGGLFGSTATTSSSGFGTNTTTSGGFGGFGQNKTANTGGGFGTSANTNTSGGLFGGGTGTGGFGSNTQTQQNNGLFGSNNNQAKPGGLFGAQNNTTSTGFGAGNNSTGGGLFGSGNNQQQQTGGGLFGGSQQQQNANPFGGANNNTTTGFGGGFGTNNNANNQAKPGLFGGGNNTSGGLFGSNQQQQTTGFGTNQNQQQSGGLFGGQNQNQPSGGLFGANNAQPKTGLFGAPATNNAGGLFGNNQQQTQQPTNGLFGNNNQQQNQNTGFGSSLFGGNQQNTQANTSLFGNNQNNSILGGSQQQQQNPLQGPAGYSASLNDPSPYGSASIFNGLPPPPQHSPGPIATPINGGSLRARKPAALPQYKLNPSAASRGLTPQKRGYGLSYSTYGTPSSVTSTPGALSSSLLGGSLGRSLGKSLSTSNLRGQLDSEPSVFSPGALTGSLRGRERGSLKRLTIDRSLRTDLFGTFQQNAPALPAPAPPAPKQPEDPRPSSNLRKRVSFDTTPGPQSRTETDNEPAESRTPTPQESGYLRSSRGANGRMSMPTQPEMDKVRGNELAIVHEDDALSATAAASANGKSNIFDQGEPAPGGYWMKPTIEELKQMTRDELKAVEGFKIGRHNTGSVAFNKPVDLTLHNLDNIYERIVIITQRNLTVYPDNSRKPAEGKGLNVPSTITLENCWPRGPDRKSPSFEKVGPRVTKHIERLKKVDGTTFVSYDRDTGEWVFSVPHFTTYGLDDDDEDDSELPEAGLGDSVVSDVPPTPTPKGKQVRTTSNTAQQFAPSSSALSSVPSEMMSVDFDDSRVSSAPGDDTFGYRRGKRFPGAFDDTPAFDESDHEDTVMEMTEMGRDVDGAASPGSAQSEDEPADLFHSEESHNAVMPATFGEDIAMAGAFPHLEEEGDITALDTPVKLIPDLNDDWAERLQHTISPRKNDRYFLKQSQALLDRGDSLLDFDATPTTREQLPQASDDFGEIKTSVDLMRSLFGKEELRRSGRKAESNGIQWPYKKSDPNSAESKMTDQEKAFHQAFKPTFTAKNQIVLRDGKGASGVEISGLNEEPQDYSSVNFQRLVQQTKVENENGIPAARFEQQPFSHGWGAKDLAHEQENTAWQLLHILFDNYSDRFSKGIPDSEITQLRHRIRKDRVAHFWAQLCEPAANRALAEAVSPEEKALAYLSMHKVSEACDVLAKGKNFRLATLVAQIGGDETQRAAMQEQIETWTTNNVLSEVNDPIRAILALLAGNTSLVAGKKGAIEDKAEAFILSQRFNLDWKRTFGLRLWYGTFPEDSLEAAVQQYARDLTAGTETRKPIPWFLDTGSSRVSSWKDPNPQSRIDLLWAILLLVAEQNQISPTLKLAEALAPENIVGNPSSYRLSFELHLMLAPLLPRAVDYAQADALAIAFSASLEDFGKWQAALWALLFLRDDEQRKHALQDALARMTLHLRNESEVRDVLFNQMKIPESWVWDAKALRARAEGDKTSEVTYLARAHKWDEAHRVLCEEVAPLAVIERSHTKLQLIIENFPNRHINDWRLGGQVYEDYLAVANGKLGGPETRVVLNNLVTALTELKPRRGEQRKMSFVQSVALSEMARVATEKTNELQDQDMSGHDAMKLLNLPGNELLRRQGLGEAGMRHFKAIMAKSG